MESPFEIKCEHDTVRVIVAAQARVACLICTPHTLRPCVYILGIPSLSVLF